MNNKYIFLDNASTTPIDQKVLNAMMPYLKDKYGNPSSLHRLGRINKSSIEKSRQEIAQYIGSETQEIFFTSGGTESDNLAIFGIARANKHKGKHIIVSCIEHKAILDSSKKLENEGFEVTYLDVDKNGIISLDQFRSSLRKDTILVSIMYANNEIGTIQPIKKISEILRENRDANPIFHCDACQATGVLPIKVKELGVDALTVSASKIYGPKGIGFLYINKKYSFEPIIYGGGQERSLRSGTENVAGIIGFAKAIQISEQKRISENVRLTKLRDYFILQIKKNIKDVVINGSLKNRLPNNLNVSIRGVEGESLVLLLDEKGVFCSTGSACSSIDLNPSHVLVKIGLPLELAHCSVRFTLGRHTRKSDIDHSVKLLVECVDKIRSITTIK